MCTPITNNQYRVKIFYRKPRYTHYCSVWNVIFDSLYQKCSIWIVNKFNQSKSEKKFLHRQICRTAKLKQEKAHKFHVITHPFTSTKTTMEGYWDQASLPAQTNGHSAPPHPVKFERWENLKFRNFSFISQKKNHFLIVWFAHDYRRDSCFWPQFSAFNFNRCALLCCRFTTRHAVHPIVIDSFYGFSFHFLYMNSPKKKISTKFSHSDSFFRFVWTLIFFQK